MFILSLFAFGFIGVVAGLLAGMLGISGGVVAIPLLVLLFNLSGFPPLCVMQLAIGTSLAAMVFNALSSTWAHHRRQSIFWDVVRAMAPGIVIGSIFGAFLARHLPGSTLRVIFGVFQIVLGIYFFFPVKTHEGDHCLPGKFLLSCIGLGIAWISSILGIGGGIITVPTLMAFHVRPKKAVATSAATGLLISMMGAGSYLYFGLSQDCGVRYSVGYLYLPAFIAISCTSFIVAPIGAKLAHILDPTILRRIFATALIFAGILMVAN